MTRRDFLRVGGFASAAFLVAGQAASQTPAGPGLVRFSPHLIPAEKNLPAGWLRTLHEKGERTPWRGAELDTVGMPIGGIAAGQLYLCGDGTLGQWEIFNRHEFIGYGAKNYAPRVIPKPVQHGFAVTYSTGNMQRPVSRRLDATGFADIAFRGEYPVGTVTYADEGSPVSATLEAFSPFIPLNAKDSALPATVMVVTLENTTRLPVDVTLLSWLENPIARLAGEEGRKGVRRARIHRGRGVRISHSVEGAPAQTDSSPPRQPILFENFERTTFAPWKVEGSAFGDGPTTGTLPAQNKVSGFEGERVVNSFHGRDEESG